MSEPRTFTFGSGGVNVGYLLTQRERLDPDRLAVTFGEDSFTYGELNRRVNRLANGMAAAGIGKGDRVAVLLTNCHQYFELLFACAKLGALIVTVNYRLVADEVGYLISDCTPKLIVHGDEFTSLVDSIDLEKTATEPVLLGAGADRRNYEDLLADNDSEPEVEVSLDDPLIIMYTSGTTGRPKGAVLSHGNIVYTSFNQIADWSVTREDRCLAVAPLYHVGGMLVLAFPCLHVGGTVHIEPGFDPIAVLGAIQANRITTLFLAPTMWNMVLQTESLETYAVSSIRLCCSGGEALPVALMKRLIALFGADFVDGYGLTEGSSCSTCLRADHVIAKTGSVGIPFLHNAVRVVDDEGNDQPVGEPGEVIQTGPTVMKGYWERPEETAKTLRDGWLHTGDVGQFDEDGFLWIVDRKKDMIISGAENIYPAEIEQVIYTHPEVLEAAVIGLPDEKWGEAVTAVVVFKDSATAGADDIVEFCRGKVANYKRPRQVKLVDALPRNPSGKVLKRELRSRFAPTTVQ
jgi:fatty-acyl-CoA synthase